MRQLWSPIRPRVGLGGVLDGGGAPTGSVEEGCRELHRHWQAVFSSKEADERYWKLFERFITPMPGGPQFLISEEQCVSAGKEKRDSAAGPDGIPYGAWSAAGEQVQLPGPAPAT